MAPIRTALLALAIGGVGAALLPSPKAEAWWARPGVWVAGPPPVRVVRPPVVVYAPPRPYPYYHRHWVPAHVDPWGRWHPGHWI